MNDNGFPTLYVPRTVRRRLEFDPLQSTPRSVQELPSRLPMGDLQRDTFKQTAEGFEVCYRSGDFSMKIDLKGDSMYAKEFYKDAELLYYIGVAKMFLGPRMTQLRLGPSEEADQLIGSDLAGIGNIKYAPFGDVMKVGSSNCFPDGFLMTIVLPLPINATTFQRVSRFFRNLPTDDSISLYGFMEFARHVVNYRQGHCGDVPDDPMMLYLWSLERGYLPIAMPVLEGQPDNQAMTLRRMGYNLVLNVYMRDMFKVVHLLKDAGLIGDQQSSRQEEAAVIANSFKLLSAKDLSFYSNDRSRRVFYPAILGDGVDMQTPSLEHGRFDRCLDDILSRYQSIVKDFRSEFDRKVVEALAHEQ